MIVALIGLVLARAQDAPGLDEIGFADVPLAAVETRPARAWSVGGTARTERALWLERLSERPLASARTAVDLYAAYTRGDVRARVEVHGELDPVYLADRFDPQTRDVFGRQAWPGEVWISQRLGPVDLTVGRQVIAWGEGLLLGPLDVVSARDLRRPGVGELDELRLPAFAVRVGWTAGAVHLEGIWMPEADFGLRNPPDGPFGLLPGFLGEAGESAAATFAETTFTWRHAQDRVSVPDSQAFLRAVWRGPGVDLSLYAASLLDRDGVLVLPEPDKEGPPTEVEIVLDHRRTTLLGHSGSAPAGPVVLRWEGTVELSRAVNTGSPVGLPPVLATEDVTLWQAMAGATFTGLQDTQVVLEATAGWVPERPEDLLLPLDAPRLALRVRRTLFRERVELVGMATVLGVDARYGGLGRLHARYELQEGLHATLGLVTYRPGSERGPLIGLHTHDQLFARLRWDF